MTGLVEAVRGKVDKACVENKGLKKKGCKISLQGAPRLRLVINFDKPGSPLGQNQKRCDYLFVGEVPHKRGWIVPLELKRGGEDATSQIVGQLQAGARAAEQLFSSNLTIIFRPVFASGGSMHKAQRTAMKKKINRVRFRDCYEPIRRLRCGDPLTRALGT